METVENVMNKMQKRSGAKLVHTSKAYYDMTEDERRAYIQAKCDFRNTIHGNLNERDGFDCHDCLNRGYITVVKEIERGEQINDFSEAIRDCHCKPIRASIMRMKRSGLENVMQRYTFDQYNAAEPWQKHVKDIAQRFIKDGGSVFYIGGQTGCVDCDTEYFDGEKWVRIADYCEGEKVMQYDPKTKRATLTVPKRYIKNPAKELYLVNTKRGGIDMCLSSDHNFAYLTSKGNMQKKPFSEVMKLHKERTQGFYGRVETAFKYSGTGMQLTDNEIRLMCAVIADGSFRDGLTSCYVNVKKERKKERMRELLAGQEYHEYKRNDGYSMFVFHSPVRTKEFGTEWYQCTHEQLKIIADEVFYWDGRIDDKGRKQFFSTVKVNADFVQFAISATGARATISVDYHKEKPCYVVTKSKGCSTVSMVSTGGRSKAEIIKVNPVDGLQYCFEVETGYLILRRNGRIFITGNSGKTHICTAITVEFLRHGKAAYYMLWQDETVRLKACVMESVEYHAQMQKLKEVEVLYIDDFFKPVGEQKAPSAADIRLAYELINYRYNNAGLITVISSERLIGEILDIDEATGGRLVEYAGEYMINIGRDKARNYRLRNTRLI